MSEERGASDQSRALRLANMLTDHIVQSGVSPGDVLPSEHKLAEQYGVSRPVVREALRLLAGRGVVEIVNGRGAVVKPLDSQPLLAYFEHAVRIQRMSFRQIMEIRRPLEVQCARLAALRRTSDQLDAMYSVVNRMRRHIGNADAYVDLDRELHHLIGEASGNLLLAHMVSALRDALNSLTHEILYRRRNRQQLERVHALHETIVTEIGYRNADAAAHAMEIHFTEALTFLIQRQEELAQRKTNV
ncbi:MAG: FadR/GntR family transcriptional regulator [Anaerolineae bacterium]|nr:FadR family transcriptional regulator [Thermoflexales bacterium]MDW8396152.1 FadR/GntR family transcriptional regulator [Anaerolineae bacterium]